MSWLPDWRGETAVVIASGPSAKEANFEALGGYRVIAVNESWKLYPNADALYACDRAWWDLHRGCPDFTGLKITEDTRAARTYGLQRVEIDRAAHAMLVEKPGHIGNGGNSGFQAVNIAVQTGVKRIILIGFDYQGEHWHGDHPRPLNNPTSDKLATWAKRLDAVAPELARLGVEVLNASPASALTAFQKIEMERRLAA
jgi:hypothetical protein